MDELKTLVQAVRTLSQLTGIQIYLVIEEDTEIPIGVLATNTHQALPMEEEALELPDGTYLLDFESYANEILGENTSSMNNSNNIVVEFIEDETPESRYAKSYISDLINYISIDKGKKIKQEGNKVVVENSKQDQELISSIQAYLRNNYVPLNKIVIT